MRYFIAIMLLLEVIVPAQAALLDPINIEINPVVKEISTPGPPYGWPTEYYVDISLPEVTLSPFDEFFINVNFTGDKMLQFDNDPYYIGLDFVLSNTDNPPPPGYTFTNDGLWHVHFLDYYKWPQVWIGGHSEVTGFPHPECIRTPLHDLSKDPMKGDVENGARIGDFTLHFLMPSQIYDFGGRPIETTTFTKNTIRIYARSDTYSEPWNPPIGPALRVVPEPATVFLLTLAWPLGRGLFLRRK